MEGGDVPGGNLVLSLGRDGRRRRRCRSKGDRPLPRPDDVDGRLGRHLPPLWVRRERLAVQLLNELVGILQHGVERPGVRPSGLDQRCVHVRDVLALPVLLDEARMEHGERRLGGHRRLPHVPLAHQALHMWRVMQEFNDSPVPRLALEDSEVPLYRGESGSAGRPWAASRPHGGHLMVGSLVHDHRPCSPVRPRQWVRTHPRLALKAQECCPTGFGGGVTAADRMGPFGCGGASFVRFWSPKGPRRRGREAVGGAHAKEPRVAVRLVPSGLLGALRRPHPRSVRLPEGRRPSRRSGLTCGPSRMNFVDRLPRRKRLGCWPNEGRPLGCHWL